MPFWRRAKFAFLRVRSGAHNDIFSSQVEKCGDLTFFQDHYFMFGTERCKIGATFSIFPNSAFFSQSRG